MMRIGVCYDLKSDYLAQGYSEEETAEFDAEVTIDAICDALAYQGWQPVKIGGIKKLAEALVAGERWDAVFNFCEGMYGLAREAQVPTLLDAYQIPYVFSDALTMALVRVAIDEGVPLFGVCRGLQELNVALGGTLYQRVHELEDMLDHREPDDEELV